MVRCSVVIGTHQRIGFLKEALASVLDQKGVDVEVIVVENGSTDGTADYLTGLQDERVRVLLYGEALGGTGARNAGLAAATGDWVGFLDDDDLWAPDKLQSEIEAAGVADRTWAYTGCVYINERCEVIAGKPPPSAEVVAHISPFRYAIPGGTSSMIWHREVLKDGGLLDQRLTYPIDWDLSLRLLRTGLPATVNRPLVAYRQHGGNMSLQAGKYFREVDIIEEKSADLRRGRPIDMAHQCRNAGSEFARAGSRGQALRHYVRSAKLGDAGSLVRAAGILLPARTWPWLRRRFLSDADWLRQSEEWLAPHRATHDSVASGGAVRSRLAR